MKFLLSVTFPFSVFFFKYFLFFTFLVKGGRESNLPIAISRIYKDQAGTLVFLLVIDMIFVKSLLIEGPERGGGGVSDPISQCYFMKNPIPILDFFKIPTHISNVVL